MFQKLYSSLWFSLGCLLLLMMFHLSEQVSLKKDLTLSNKEKQILDKFRRLVIDRLPHEYMKKEIYLIRWLRAKKFNILEAEEFLMQNLKWRKENNMDTILKEDWSDFNERFVHDFMGCDKGGRPIVHFRVGEWDVRQAVVSGQSQKMMRYYDMLYEEITTYIRVSQECGENVTQYDLLLDLTGYNLVIQGCPLCVPVYIHFFQSYENHYPGMNHRTYLVNVPQIFIPLWNTLSPLLSEPTRTAITLHGKNPTEWKPILLRDIGPLQLTKEYGGVKEEVSVLEELRANGGHLQCQKYAAKVKE